MRSLIGVSIAILVIISGWFLSYRHVDNHAENFIESLNLLERKIEAEEWDMVMEKYSEMKAQWHQIRHRWAIIIDHHEIDNIDLALARTRKYVQEKDKPLSLGEIEVLKQLFQIVKESEAVTLTNIL
ncbi:DUF4363 family protein [Thermotalea metallivorans]|uniref:DUF4363 domain-containing protein n=1 Tax=Thermotalea metallivorans TaxID=520762 RepID=A0A140L173_9FIRM|nr:DUF4363 family protein [Thermotalea metallivorans]KXG74298.1 hypothetical protein AN619_24900 [Thermotalea metallivorans]